ncbi:MAG: TonB-dependent receptor plug domain-containing protein, partial [Gemmatimonadota bacterium]|nr:TonB-dependent receptor plug domain-containing protein [Gemmatimonadota bacterium]
MIKNLFAACLVCFAPGLVAAQTVVHGTVTDGQSGVPLAGAVVATTDSLAAAASNDAGAFSLSSSAPVAAVTVSKPGYTTVQVAVTDASRALRIRLSPSTAVLAGVTVTANAAAPSVAELSPADLARSSGLSLENSVNTVPGVFMQSRTPWGGARITIRGYYPSTSGNSPNANGLGYNVFINDIPVTDASGGTILDDVDYSSLGNVEIIKGATSSLYGSQIGGAVRFSTARPPVGQTGFSQQLLSGSNGLLRSNSAFQTSGSNSDLVVNYGHQSYNSFRPHSASVKDFARATGDFSVSDAQSLGTYFSYNRSFEELAGEIDSADFYARRPVSNAAYLANDSHIQITSFVAGVTDHYQFGDNFSNKTTLFGNGRSFSQPFAHGFTDANQFSFGGRTAFGYSASLGAAGVTGTLGASLQRTNITSNGVFIVPAPRYTERPTAQENYATNASVFTEWSLALPDALTVTVGASLNSNRFAIRNMLKNGQLFDTTAVQVRKFDAVLTPRVSVSKRLGDNTSLYASVSAGVTPPLLSNVISNTGAVNLALKPERATQYEIGGQTSLLDNRLSAQAALFDVENTDKLVSQTANSVTFTTNAGKQRDRGAELALGFALIQSPTEFVSLLRPWAAYTYTDSRYISFRSDNNATANTVNYSGNDVPRVPRNMLSAGLDAGSSTGVYINGTYRYVGKVPVTLDNSTYVRSYDLLGARIGYRRGVT